MGAPRWPSLAVEIMYEYWGAFKADDVTARINRACGTNYSTDTARQKAHALGLDAREAQGWITAAEAGRQIGISTTNAVKAIERYNIERVGRSLYVFITHEGLEQLRKHYPILTEPCVSSREAGRRLGYTDSNILLLIKAGKLRAIKRGGFHHIPISDIERFIWDRAREHRKTHSTVCATCGTPSSLKYCGKKCQRKAWNSKRDQQRAEARREREAG